VNVYVTSIGIVSPIGLDAGENFKSLALGRGGIRLSAVYNVMTGDVTLSNEQIVRQLDLPAADYSRTALLALIAAREAWGGSKHDPLIRTGLISATSIGGLDRSEKSYIERRLKGLEGTSKDLVHDIASTTDAVARDIGIKGCISTISTACSSGANSIMYGARLMQNNLLDRALVGGSDPLVRYSVEGFRALGIYDPEVCKPFDARRKGLNLGEGSAFMVLENEHSISRSGRKPICKLTGWNNSADAFHQTSSSADGKGAWLSITKALEKARLKPAQVDYINAHGTGTRNNDISESKAFIKVFGRDMAPFSSTKGFIGHTLAAAGAIEAVFSVMAIQTQSVLPNLHFETPIEDTGLQPAVKLESRSIEHVLSTSFGFGGNCTSLVFSKVN
jgi:3-oxoacyl-(acyl-carrier-protein) synthase